MKHCLSLRKLQAIRRRSTSLVRLTTREPSRPAHAARWIALSLAVSAALLVSGCSSPVESRLSSGAGRSVQATAPAVYEPPADGSGFATQPMDQPYPLPSSFWRGRQDMCDGITAEVARAAGGTGEISSVASGCYIFLGGAELIQVAEGGPYSWVTDPTHFVRPVTIAGLEARERAFTGQGVGECSVVVNTRAPISLMFGAFNAEDPNSGDREQRCAAARKAAEAVVTRYVPLAGGTPWEPTPQQPPAHASEGMTACEIIGDSAAVYGHTSPKSKKAGTDPLGTTCTYTSSSTSLDAFVTDGTVAGLADIETRVEGAAVTDRRLGELPARVEDAGTTCAVLVEFVPQRVFGVTYHVDVPGAACKFAEVVAAVVLTKLVDQSEG